MDLLIAPSILSADFSKLGEEIQRGEKAGADWIHVDVMDGLFVPNLTFGPPVIAHIRKCTDLPFDVHLMIQNPERYIDEYVKAGADSITVHVESTVHLHRTLQQIKNHNVKAAVSLNPATPLQSIEYVLDQVDMVLLMSVNPGFGGQSYIPAVTEKIKALSAIKKGRNLNFDIQVDGGVTLDNIAEVTAAGANVIVAGSAIYGAKDMVSTINQFRESAK